MSQFYVGFSAGELPPSVPLRFITNFGTSVPVGYAEQVIVNQAAQGYTVSTSAPGSTNIININLVDASDNIFIGRVSGNATYTGTNNVGVGTGTFQNLTTGIQNVALGVASLNKLTSGSNNLAIGENSLHNIITTSNNTAVGQGSMADTTGFNNTAVGFNSMTHLVSGNTNIALGYTAGQNYTSLESNNIAIGNLGSALEGNTIRIGTQGPGTGQQNRVFIAGITGTAVSASAPVAVNSLGQLSSLNFGTSGQVLTSNGPSTSPTWQTVGEISWQVNTTTPITVVANNGYIANESSATLVYNLPATAAVGDRVAFTNISSTHPWQLQANTGQTITLGTVSSTVAGTATSTQNGDTVTLICTVANTNWQVISSIGNITLA